MTPRERPDEMDREDVLMVASRLMTGKHDPHIVLPVADHILSWLAGDGGQDGVRLRHAAMIRQFQNLRGEACRNDPDAFIAAASKYVPFLAGVTE